MRAAGRHQAIEQLLAVLRPRILDISVFSTSRVMVEFDTGGNVRLEEGKPSDLWFRSCAELVNSRFLAHDFQGLGISGIRVNRVKFILFLMTGAMSGLAAICLTSRLGSTRPSIGMGMELEVVTMVVLGGVSILGGSGTITGVIIAAFVMGLVTFGLGLLNVPGIVMSIFIGLLLIGVIALPRLWQIWRM